jgi:hypothetical protein
MRGWAIFHTGRRNLKHISVVACISAAGEHMTPFMVCSQFNDAVERVLTLQGFGMRVDLILRKRKKPYLNSELFHEYTSKVLVPCIDELRTNAELVEKEAILLLENCFIYAQRDSLKLLADHLVKVITFMLHTNQIFQCFDLSLFGNLKNKIYSELPLEKDETSAGFIKRIFHTMKQTLVEDNVRSAFGQLGLHYGIEADHYVLPFDEDMLRRNPGFTSLWERDYPHEKLSGQCIRC